MHSMPDHYNRPTLGVPSAKFSAQKWGSAQIEQIASHYGARYLIASRTDNPEDYNLDSSLLMKGDELEWLTLARTFDTAFVYRIEL